jgi:hypothetical protein
MDPGHIWAVLFIMLALVWRRSQTTPDTTPAPACDTAKECAFPQKILNNPTIRLNNGVEMPTLSLGSAQLILAEQHNEKVGATPNFVGLLPERTFRATELALQAGMRAFDTVSVQRSSI